jgi:hypothetical protein
MQQSLITQPLNKHLMGMSESMKKIIDVSEERNPKLTKRLLEISKKHKAVLLTIIAPYVGRKITPTKTLSAHIGLSEEFAIDSYRRNKRQN